MVPSAAATTEKEAFSLMQNEQDSSTLLKVANMSAAPRLGKKNSQQSADFFKNFVIESVDQEGRTSMRQVMKSEREGRASIINQFKMASDGNIMNSSLTGQNLKFIRKSDLSQDLFTNKSVISIKGAKNGEVEVQY